MNIKNEINQIFFQGSYYRVYYALKLMKRAYKRAGMRKEPAIEDLKSYFGIDYWNDTVGDSVHGNPEKQVPSIYIPFPEEIEEDAKLEQESYDIVKLIEDDMKKMAEYEKTLKEIEIKNKKKLK